MIPTVKHFSEVLEQSMLRAEHPIFPQEGSIQGKLVRWFRSVISFLWDIVVTGSYARAVYERVHEMALNEFKKANIAKPEEVWLFLTARVVLANLSQQSTPAWKILAQIANQMSSVAWVVDRAHYNHHCKTVLSHTMRRLSKSPLGDSLLNKPLFMEVLHLMVPSETQWPYVQDVEPFSSEAARSSYWEHLFGEPCPSRTWEEFDNQLIARMSQNVEVLSEIVRDLPHADFEWLCQLLFQKIHQLVSSREKHLSDSLQGSDSWLMVTEQKINWLGIASKIDGLSLAIEPLSSSYQALALAIYFSVCKSMSVDFQVLVFVTDLVAKSKGWTQHPSLLLELMLRLKREDLSSLHSFETLWEAVVCESAASCKVTRENLAYSLSDLFFFYKWLGGVERPFQDHPHWTRFLEIPALLSSMRQNSEVVRGNRLSIKVESWLLLISLYCKHGGDSRTFTREGFYQFMVGYKVDSEEVEKLSSEEWLDRFLSDMLLSLDGRVDRSLEAMTESHAARIQAWELLVELGLFRNRAREIIQNLRQVTLSLSDFEKSFVVSSVGSTATFDQDWLLAHADTVFVFSEKSTGLDEGKLRNDIQVFKDQVLAYCEENTKQAEGAFRCLSQPGLFPFKLLSDVLNVKMALAKKQNPGAVLSERSAYTYHLSMNENKDVVVSITIQPSLEHAISGYVEYMIDLAGQVRANDFSFIQS